MVAAAPLLVDNAQLVGPINPPAIAADHPGQHIPVQETPANGAPPGTAAPVAGRQGQFRQGIASIAGRRPAAGGGVNFGQRSRMDIASRAARLAESLLEERRRDGLRPRRVI